VLNYVGVSTPTPADITAAATHMLYFIDMGGHEKYLKTTLYGMTCLLPGKRCLQDQPQPSASAISQCLLGGGSHQCLSTSSFCELG